MASSPKPRVRFAPSPTGYLHIGGARTALFSWLWARKHGGSFILRIEDTDRERSTDESRRVILDSMRWLGLDWDEGPDVGGPHAPYLQLQRLNLYAEYAERLISRGTAYRCYCTKDDLEAARNALKARDPKATFRYPGTCRNRTDKPDRPYVVRFCAPTEGNVVYDDLVFGSVATPNSAQQDFVLIRSDGVPLYNFGAVVDDIDMKITLVARGRDHMVNTPPQILLYEALGVSPPQFAHLPLMLAQSGEKLAKRHAAVSVGEYRALGYTPAGVLNYLARFGWSHGDEEIFSRDELIAKFDFANVGRADGKFDPKKFADVAFEHLKRAELTSLESYAAMVRPFLDEAGVTQPTDENLRKAIPTIRERARTLREAAAAMSFFFQPPVFDEKAKAKFLTAAIAPRLAELAGVLRSVDTWAETPLESAVTAWLASKNLSIKDVAQPARVALTGRSASPGLFDVLAVLGRDESLARIDGALRLIGTALPHPAG
jgi:glutamyl-tRNA synthetase